MQKIVLFLISFFNILEQTSAIHPPEIRVDQGNRVVFQCNMEGPKLWYHEKNRKLPYSLAKADTNDLVLPAVSKEDSGYYFCVCRPPKSSDFFVSKAELMVNGDFQIKVYVTLNIDELL